MQDFPHHYRCVATANADQSRVRVSSQGLEDLTPTFRASLAGPAIGGRPALLIAAVADCFVLTFRAMATPSQIKWYALDCDASGTLERVDRASRFTHIDLSVRISVPDEMDRERCCSTQKSRGNLLNYQLTQCNGGAQHRYHSSVSGWASHHNWRQKKARLRGAFSLHRGSGLRLFHNTHHNVPGIFDIEAVSIHDLGPLAILMKR